MLQLITSGVSCLCRLSPSSWYAVGSRCGFNFHSLWSVVGMAPFLYKRVWESGRSVFETQTPWALSELLKLRLHFFLCEVGTGMRPSPRWKGELWEVSMCMSVVIVILAFLQCSQLSSAGLLQCPALCPTHGHLSLIHWLLGDRMLPGARRKGQSCLGGKRWVHSLPHSGFRGAWPSLRWGQAGLFSPYVWSEPRLLFIWMFPNPVPSSALLCGS